MKKVLFHVQSLASPAHTVCGKLITDLSATLKTKDDLHRDVVCPACAKARPKQLAIAGTHA
jgi:hypothetical protein